jgi:hypothetical protein
MATIQSENVRIPKSAREALARHETVVVLNRDRPAYVLLSPEHHRRSERHQLGRPAREVIELLSGLPQSDPEFVADMEAVLASVGPLPADPWERS